MTENKTDPDIQRRIFEEKRNEFYRKFKDELGIDIVKNQQLEKIFSNGIKEGSVIFVPRKDGTGILNVNTVIDKKRVSKNIEVDDKDEAAFLLGLQGSLTASKE